MPQANDFDGGHIRPFPTERRGPNAVRPDCDAQLAEGAQAQRELERFVSLLMRGDRIGCRDLVREWLNDGHSAVEVLEQLLWPACSVLDGWARRDQISAVHQHCATVLLSQLVQRIEAALPRRASRCRPVLVASGQSPLEELAAEMFVGLAEADGFDVVFLGGGVESDDLFEEIGQRKPAFVIRSAGAGSDAAPHRRLLKSLQEQRPVPGLRVGAGGGVFSRAPGLAEELGVDFSGDSPFDLLEALRRDSEAPQGRQRGSRAA
ncbi:MAG: B12-binding domain-containing protein [bacterium]